MAASDILNLDRSLAPRLIRILYGLTLVLIALGVVLGLIQGVRTATRMPPLPPLQMSGVANQNTPQTQVPTATNQSDLREDRFDRRSVGSRRFGADGFPGQVVAADLA